MMNKELIPLFTGSVIGLCGLIGGLFFFSYLMVCKILAFGLSPKRLPETANLLAKINWRNFFETNLRAETGTALNRPFGSPVHYFFWERIIFNPVYLSREPLTASEEILTKVTLGPQAKRPLVLEVPLIIGGMSYGGALSFKAKMALAKASTITGTTANSGSGPFLDEERAAADKYILQYSRGFWGKSESILSRAEMIEISLGHGAWGSAPVRIKGEAVTNGYARRMGTVPGLDVLIEARLPEVENQADWKELTGRLKEITAGVPIAVKIGGTHYLETELARIMEGDVDVIIVDGAEGGSHAVPPILSDDVGLPTLPGLCRAAQYLKAQGLSDKVSLLVGGGLFTPGDFLKCLALGANAVIIGTIAVLAMSHTQVIKSSPWEPPTGLLYYGGKAEQKFDADLGVKHLNNYLQSCVREMAMTAGTLGKKSLQEVDRTDLIALEPIYAEMAGIEYFFH